MSETDKNIYLGQNQVTVDEFMQSLNIPNGAVAQLAGQGGSVKSEGYLAIGDYLRVENSNTQNFYLVSPIKPVYYPHLTAAPFRTYL